MTPELDAFLLTIKSRKPKTLPGMWSNAHKFQEVIAPWDVSECYDGDVVAFEGVHSPLGAIMLFMVCMDGDLSPRPNPGINCSQMPSGKPLTFDFQYEYDQAAEDRKKHKLEEERRRFIIDKLNEFPRGTHRRWWQAGPIVSI